MSERIFVTGIGIISSIGNGVEETMQHFRELKSGIGPITSLNTVHKNTLPIAEVKLSNKELKQMLGINPTAKKIIPELHYSE